MKNRKMMGFLIVIITGCLYFFGTKEICDWLILSCDKNFYSEPTSNHLEIYSIKNNKLQVIRLKRIEDEKIMREKYQEIYEKLDQESQKQLDQLLTITKNMNQNHLFYWENNDSNETLIIIEPIKNCFYKMTYNF